MSSPVPKVKVCGFTRPEDAHAALRHGVAAIGVNFWPGSKRFVAPDSALPWLRELSGEVLRVVLLVNAPLSEALRWVGDEAVDAVQLHGDEADAYMETVAGAASAAGKKLIRAVRPPDEASVATYRFPAQCDVLVDAFVPGAFGGTGVQMPPGVAQAVRRLHPGRVLWLAGGLTPVNVAHAVAEVRPDWVDVAGGVETAPGIKNADAIRAFVEATKIAGNHR